MVPYRRDLWKRAGSILSRLAVQCLGLRYYPQDSDLVGSSWFPTSRYQRFFIAYARAHAVRTDAFAPPFFWFWRARTPQRAEVLLLPATIGVGSGESPLGFDAM